MKGQWFIISAVVATSVFLSISMLLQNYFIVDSSSQARVNADYYFYNFLDQFNEARKVTTDGNCTNLTTNLESLKNMVQNTLASKGLFMYFEYQIVPPDCSGDEDVNMDLVIATREQIIYNFTNYNTTDEIIGAG